jgi:predicted Ser/Thr protein kinase
MNIFNLAQTVATGTKQFIPFNELRIEDEIGQGRYGKVCLGKWGKTLVALKFCTVGGSVEDFIKEANVML